MKFLKKHKFEATMSCFIVIGLFVLYFSVSSLVSNINKYNERISKENNEKREYFIEYCMKKNKTRDDCYWDYERILNR